MPIADWLPYPPSLYINIGFGLSLFSAKLDLEDQKNHMINSDLILDGRKFEE